MTHLIELKDVYKIYPMGDETVHALDGVSLSIDQGEFVAIVGSSGSGKSTAMNIIGCLDVPTSGSYHLGGVDVSTMDDDQQAEIRNKMLGFIFQQYNLIPKLSVLENVELPLLYAGVPAEERRERERDNDLYRPKFDVPAPVEKFRIEIKLNHPYWKSFDEKISGPEFDRDYPRAADYMKSYREQTEELHQLAKKLMHMMDPKAGETQVGGAAAAAATAQSAAQAVPTVPADAVAEIQKYKALLDAGVLTEEEFTAKKRQLLGI